MPRGGKREGAGRKLSYESYKNQWKANAAKLATNGFTMKQRMLSKTEFEAKYTQYKNERKDEIKAGNRKTLGNITRDIVEDQTYNLSAKQARAMLKEKRKGKTLMEIRAGTSVGDVYQQKKQEFKDAGIENAAAEAKRYISTEFFGS